jgi:hypothetical protein
LVADLATGGGPPAGVAFLQNWGDSTLLDGWHDDGDLQLVGDFTGVGHDQVLFLNRGGTGGRVLVVDLAGGPAAPAVAHLENWGDSPLLDGWDDDLTRRLVGDFTGVGHDQVLFLDRAPGGGRVLVVDYGAGTPAVAYLEGGGDSPLLDGWDDDGDLVLVGDFTEVGHDQVLLVNRSGTGGRVLVADFATGGGPPATAAYWENWGDSGLLDDWLDDGDLMRAGDFTGVGHDQVLLMNRSGTSGRVLVADFADPGSRTFTAATCAVVATTLHVCALTRDGRVWHTGRAADGSWQQGLDDVGALAGSAAAFRAVGCGAHAAGLAVFGVAEDGRVLVAVRDAGGAWSPFAPIPAAAGDPGRARAVSASGDGGELHLQVVTASGLLRHATWRSDGTWRPFDDGRQPERDRAWRYREFRGREAPRLRETLSDQAAIDAYRQDPFNPHAIARLRLSAYQKSTVMKSVDNLLDWGDDLFTQFETETVNEAALLYVTAAEILGPEPVELGDCGDGGDGARTYEQIAPLMAAGSEFLLEAESLTLAAVPARRRSPAVEAVLGRAAVTAADALWPAGAARPFRIDWRATTTESWQPRSLGDRSGADARPLTGPGSGLPSAGLAAFGTSLLQQVGPVFCVPANDELRRYRGRVRDRLQKIRNCMDIDGNRRALAPFAPEIDPRVLVRARAAGIPLEGVLASSAGNLPPYRFEYLIERAKQHAAAVQSFGAALLAALEKKDAEELARLRAVHEQTMLALATNSFQLEIDAAQDAVDALTAQKATVAFRRDHYQALRRTGRIPWEHAQAISRHTASAIYAAEGVLSILVGSLGLLPQLGSPFAMKWGGAELSQSFSGFANAADATAKIAEAVSASAGIEAGFLRRDEDWKHQQELAKREIEGLDAQLAAAELRKRIATRAKDSHARSVAHAEEVFDLFRSKFSELGLYTQLATSLQRLHREAFNGALAMARLAEQALRFERGDDVGAELGTGQWDAARAGLLAGERLTVGLLALERRYIETNHRELEITQPFSVLQLDPAALLSLRETGECTFAIPELAFDLFYPGHYRRRIKAVRLTVPCVTGPYVNVSANLTLLDSEIRRDPDLSADPVPVPRRRSVTIAASTAQADGGVFEMSFRDERYMPFEGHGGASRWHLRLPRTHRPFDYQTISDVVVALSYTAAEDAGLRDAVEDANAAVVGTISNRLQSTSAYRILGLRGDFASAFARLVGSAEGTEARFEISERHFPAYLRGRALSVRAARVALRLAPEANPTGLHLEIDGTELTSFNARSDLGELLAADVDLANDPRGVHTVRVTAGGSLGTDGAGALDDRKLLDVLLVIEYRVAL